MFYVLFFVMLIGRMAMANQRIVIEPQTVYIHPMPSNAYQSIPTNQPVQAQTYGYRPNQASPAYIPTNIPIRTPQGTVVNVPFFKQVQANVENPAALEASTYNQPLPQNPQPFQQPQQQFVHHQQQQQPPHQPQYQPQSMMNRPHPLPQPVQDQFFGTIQHPPPCNNLKSQVASKMAQFVAEHKENVPKKANPSEPIKFELEVDSKGNIKGHGMTMSGETIYFPETEAPPSTEPHLPPLQHPQQYPQRQQLQHPQQQSQYPQQYPQQQQQQQQSQYPQQYPQQQQQLQNPQQYSQQQPQQQQSQYPQQYSQQQPQQQQQSQYPQQQQQQLQYSQQYPQQQQQQQLQYPQQYPQQQQSLQYPQQPQQPQIPSAQRPDWQPVRHYPY